MYLYDYLLSIAIQDKPALVRYILLFFILSFIFILEIGLSVCVTLSNIYLGLPLLWTLVYYAVMLSSPYP